MRQRGFVRLVHRFALRLFSEMIAMTEALNTRSVTRVQLLVYSYSFSKPISNMLSRS